MKKRQLGSLREDGNDGDQDGQGDVDDDHGDVDDGQGDVDDDHGDVDDDHGDVDDGHGDDDDGQGDVDVDIKQIGMREVYNLAQLSLGLATLPPEEYLQKLNPQKFLVKKKLSLKTFQSRSKS